MACSSITVPMHPKCRVPACRPCPASPPLHNHVEEFNCNQLLWVSNQLCQCSMHSCYGVQRAWAQVTCPFIVDKYLMTVSYFYLEIDWLHSLGFTRDCTLTTWYFNDTSLSSHIAMGSRISQPSSAKRSFVIQGQAQLPCCLQRSRCMKSVCGEWLHGEVHNNGPTRDRTTCLSDGHKPT